MVKKEAFEGYIPEHILERSRSILAAVTRLFLANGLGVTVGDVVAASGVSRPGFFAFFRSKKEILPWCFDTFWLRVNTEIEVRTMGLDQHPRSQLVALLKLLIEFFESREPDASRLFLLLSRAGDVQGRVGSQFQKFIHTLDQIILRDFENRKATPKHPIALMREALLAVVEGPLYAKSLSEREGGQYPADYTLRDVEKYLAEQVKFLLGK